MENKLFGEKYRKAVTFSFDDGVDDDIRLVELFNKYGLKCTFNLNSSKLTAGEGRPFETKIIKHINYCDNPKLYNGHEIAGHSYSHPNLCSLSADDLHNEIALDKMILEHLYDTKIVGFAYPYGTYNDTVAKELLSCGIKYSRTVRDTLRFSVPENPILLDPTCHYKQERLFELADEFLNDTSEEPLLFYIWGHSYELVGEDDWKRLENFCEKISGKEDVYYCTNAEALGL